MDRAAEWYVMVTGIIIGLSHILHPGAWADAFAALHRLGKPGAFVNGALNLFQGAVFVAVHPAWSGPSAVLTLLGWGLVLKGSIGFLAPDLSLRGIAKAGAFKGQEFRVGGLVLVTIAGIMGYVIFVA